MQKYIFFVFAQTGDMESIKGQPFFCKAEKIKRYPYLNHNIFCDILIVGGGIDGAIANHYLSMQHNMESSTQ